MDEPEISSGERDFSNIEIRKVIEADGSVTTTYVKKKPKPNIAKSAFETARNLAAGGFASADVAKRRLDICFECDEFTARNTCKICGCFMEAKTRVAYAEFPIGKWTSIKEGMNGGSEKVQV